VAEGKAKAAPEGKTKPARKFNANQAPNARIAYQWTQPLPLHVRAMVLAGRTIFVAGPPDLVDEEEAVKNFADPAVQAKLAEQSAALDGRHGALLLAVSAASGEKLAEHKLAALPVFDGMAAAGGRLYLALADGSVLCFGPAK
jgi:hypothetical protein